MHSKVPLKKALAIIFGSTILISGSCALFVAYFKYIHWQLAENPKYEILAIVQETSAKEPLKTVYLAELLKLSLDKRTNIYRFSTHLAKKRLVSSPLIKKAEVKKIYPGTVHVHYTTRVPVAFLTDFENMAIDKEGFLFPFKPFFTPKNLPEIYLGLEEDEEKEVAFGNRLENKKAALALQLLETFSEKLLAKTSIKRIDVKGAFAKSVGQKQIVLILEDKIEKIRNGFPVFSRYLRILRLSSDDYLEGLSSFLVLQKHLQSQENAETFTQDYLKIIDLRIPELGFIKKEMIK
ncbi:MAG TPA: FtsQ-type POTRA domain-containing protein [Parachlamydiaceae bacterium]|nr:FtsQ-type POTRA domain-containing protein [Parachlamydiaceae bacterium]